MSNVLQENITGIRVVRAFGRQQDEVDKFEKVNSEHLNRGLKVAPLDALYWSSGDLFSAIQMLIIVVACILANKRKYFNGRFACTGKLFRYAFVANKAAWAYAFRNRQKHGRSWQDTEVLREKEEPKQIDAENQTLTRI